MRKYLQAKCATVMCVCLPMTAKEMKKKLTKTTSMERMFEIETILICWFVFTLSLSYGDIKIKIKPHKFVLQKVAMLHFGDQSLHSEV